MKNTILALSVLFSVSACIAENPANITGNTRLSRPETMTMKIRLTIDGVSTTAILIDSPTTRDFIALLPLTLKLDDYASTEKIAYLPNKLTTQGAPAGIDPAPGDIAYYAPWGNLAIFYKDFGYSTGLVKLGRLDTDAKILEARGPGNARLELIQQ